MWNHLLNLINFKTYWPAIGVGILFFSLCTTSIVNADTGADTGHAKKVNTAPYEDIKTYTTHALGGVLPATQNSNLSAQISAIIKTFHADTGHEVNKGDLLVSLDCKENQLKLKQASANLQAEKVKLDHATTQFNQAKRLNKQGNIAKELYNQREAEGNRLKATLDNKKAAYSLAQINVDRCLIKAPYQGYITQRHASIGELTQLGTALLHLVSKTNDSVEVKINNRLLNSFSRGENYRFVFNDKSYALSVKFILPILDKKSRNHIARLSFTGEHAITGSVGKVIWQDTLPSIPSSYIVSRNKKLGIFIAENDGTNNSKAKFIEIEDAREGQPAFIRLDDKTQIITQGRFNIKDGDPILVNN